MGTTVYVKVVGFRDAERHAINTLFRLSQERPASYTLWTPEIQVAPHVALMDVESYEGGLELASPGFNPNQKLVCIGLGGPETAWRTFTRPINWPAVLHALDALFTGSTGLDIDFGLDGDSSVGPPPGIRATLLVEADAELRLYLRARLALAGLFEVDEATSLSQVLPMARQRPYQLVMLGLDAPDSAGWELLNRLLALEPRIGSVVLCTADASWNVQEKAEQAGCRGVLHKPFDPKQIARMLQNV